MNQKQNLTSSESSFNLLLHEHEAHELNKLLRKAIDVVGVEQRSTFSQRLIAPKCTTERHRKSFLPVAIKLYNSSL